MPERAPNPGFCIEPRSRRRVAAASHGVDYPAECCLCRRTGPVGLTRSHHCLDVSAGPRWSSAATVPLPLAKQGSSSRALRSPSEFLLAVTCPRASPPRAPPLGFRPSSRHQLEESSTRRTIPRSPAFRPQRFTRSRRFAPPRALRACFIAQPCPGFQLQGFDPTTQPHRLVGDRFPLVVGSVACRLPGASESSRRPQGFAPSRDSQYRRVF